MMPYSDSFDIEGLKMAEPKLVSPTLPAKSLPSALLAWLDPLPAPISVRNRGYLAFAVLLPFLVLSGGSPAWASDYCPDRPGINTPPCTIALGRLSVETSLADWAHVSDTDTVTDTVLLGDLALRFGIGARAEARLAWTPFGHVRTRDRTTGSVASASGSGDITFGMKRNILDPGGDHLSIALLPSVTLPVGGEALGAGTWSAHLQLPMSLAAGHGLSLLLTPEIDAAANGDGSSQHLAFGTAGGIAFSPVAHLNIALEAAIMHDQDPSGTSTKERAGASAGWMLSNNFQIDFGAEVGLNHAVGDHRFYLGIARQF
jgi:hypothetical protein